MQRRVDFREQYRAHVRQQIVELAHPILADEGEDAVTMSKLAKLVGLSIGSIYRYFPSRRALLALLWRERIEALTATVEPHLEELPSEATEALLVHARAWTAAAGADPGAAVKLADALQTHLGPDTVEEALIESTSVADPLVGVLADASPAAGDLDRARWLAAVLLRVIATVTSPPPAGPDTNFVDRTVEALVKSWTHQD